MDLSLRKTFRAVVSSSSNWIKEILRLWFIRDLCIRAEFRNSDTRRMAYSGAEIITDTETSFDEAAT